MATKFPTFGHATQRLQSFLTEQGWPESIVWVDFQNIKQASPDPAEFRSSRPYDEVAARIDYDRAVRAGLGVAFEGLAATTEQSFVAVTWPRDTKEAEYLMYGHNDLKISLRVPPPALVYGNR